MTAPNQPERHAEGLESAIRRRRMRRNFQEDAIDEQLLDRILDLARRAPSAGHTQATEFVVLRTPSATNRYWDTTLPTERRKSFRWDGLLRAPVLVLVCTRPSAYTQRYSETDKSNTGRESGLDRWPVPYWWFDAGAAAQNLLLLAASNGLGACLFGPFDHETEIRKEFSIGEEQRIAAVIALGHPLPDEQGRSADRGWKPTVDVVHYID